MPTINALRTVISDGQKSYPIFLGFLSAADLSDVAAVPSFTPASSNYEIANNVLSDPVEDWQRPPIDEKVEEIRERFSRTSEFMPNPVLLAVKNKDLVSVNRQSLNGQLTEIYEITVDKPAPESQKPLWILDGQHRVLGLSKSSRSTNPIPLVLLHNDTLGDYAPKQFAKIFAEVTTLATPLHAIHSDWLQFAFRLGPYGSDQSPDWRAMRAVAELCRAQDFTDPSVTNPFFNKISFNPVRSPEPAIHHGFAFTCTGLKDLIRDYYYGQPSATANLIEPGALASQVARATTALALTTTTTTSKNAFFGDQKSRQKYMEEGFLIGVLTFLHSRGAPADWEEVLTNLGMPDANWDFTGWVVTTGGNSGTLSKNISRSVFKSFFAAGELPSGVTDIPTYLRGDSATITFRSSLLTPNGRAKKHGFEDRVLPVSGVKKLDLGPRRHLKLSSLSSNVGSLDVRDAHDTFSTTYSASALRKGIALPLGPGLIELEIGSSLYGNTRPAPLTLEITWS